MPPSTFIVGVIIIAIAVVIVMFGLKFIQKGELLPKGVIGCVAILVAFVFGLLGFIVTLIGFVEWLI